MSLPPDKDGKPQTLDNTMLLWYDDQVGSANHSRALAFGYRSCLCTCQILLLDNTMLLWYDDQVGSIIRALAFDHRYLPLYL